MSRSSASNADRGQVQPLPALVAVLVLTLVLTAYGDVAQSVPAHDAPSPADPALKRVASNATAGAVLNPGSLSPTAAGLDGYRVNVTLHAPDHRRSLGPSPPTDAAHASTRVAVAWNDRVRPGVLRVGVWPWTAA